MAVAPAIPARADEWPIYAGDAAHSGVAPRAARDLTRVRWIAPPAADESFVWHSSPVVFGGRVFVRGRVFAGDAQPTARVIALAVEDGQRLWSAPVAADDYESWASLAVDVRHETVVVASGDRVCALATADGQLVWQTQLDRTVVNASPIVTTDLEIDATPANRVFISDYSGYGGVAALYAINVDPYDPPANPYQPGEIVWRHPLAGGSGNTPAYAEGIVYVASVAGEIQAIDARDGGTLWLTDVDLSGYPQYSGFYGGVVVRDGYVYATSYVFFGTGDNSGLFKLDATDGGIVWVVPCERTDAMPVVVGDGRIYLAAGIDGYGSAVKVQAFEDHGDWAEKVWDTQTLSCCGTRVGGWTEQPVWSRGYLYVGTPSGDGDDLSAPYAELCVLDTTREPEEPGFIVSSRSGAGASPAVADGTIYSLGLSGLMALDPSPACLADLNGDGVVGLVDLATLLTAYGGIRNANDGVYDSDADLNRDGVVDLEDLAMMAGVYGEACP